MNPQTAVFFNWPITVSTTARLRNSNRSPRDIKRCFMLRLSLVKTWTIKSTLSIAYGDLGCGKANWGRAEIANLVIAAKTKTL